MQCILNYPGRKRAILKRPLCPSFWLSDYLNSCPQEISQESHAWSRKRLKPVPSRRAACLAGSLHTVLRAWETSSQETLKTMGRTTPWPGLSSQSKHHTLYLCLSLSLVTEPQRWAWRRCHWTSLFLFLVWPHWINLFSLLFTILSFFNWLIDKCPSLPC